MADTPPTSWDFARDPAERDRWSLHLSVEALMHPVVTEESAFESGDELRLEQARVELEGDDAAHSPDVRLAFDLGVVYEKLAVLQADEALQEKAATVLGPAVAANPNHPGAVQALYALATALAYLDRPRDELLAWKAYLPKIEDDERRIVPMTNMGEAQMRLGQVDAALATFREAQDLCQSLPNSASLSEPYALVLWDIAIALDRLGDPVDALRTAGHARAFSWTVHGPFGSAQGEIRTGWDAIQNYVDVFFVPAWERDWYLALGEAALAGEAGDPRVAARGWAAAERDWDDYFIHASAVGGDGASRAERAPLTRKWAAMAKLRRDHAQRARLAAERRAASLPPLPPPSKP